MNWPTSCYSVYHETRETPEGQKVGMVKKFAVNADASTANQIKITRVLIDNMLVIPLEYFRSRQINPFVKVFVCGDWIGCVKNGVGLCQHPIVTSLLTDTNYEVELDEEAQAIYFWPRKYVVKF